MTTGWPVQRKQCNSNAIKFWEHRAELTLIQDILMKGQCIVIPKSLQKEVLLTIHEGHLGAEKCKRQARQSVFWPEMSADIEATVKACKTCQKMLPTKPSDPLKHHPLPQHAWQKVGTDIFQLGNTFYLIVANYYSLWPEVYYLPQPNSDTVIDVVKQAFSHHGIAEEVVSDNGSQYSSHKFKKFSREWDFIPKSNRLVESMVKSVKRLLKKCQRSKEVMLKGLLILRNTPLACGKSPSQLLQGKQLRDSFTIYVCNRPAIHKKS